MFTASNVEDEDVSLALLEDGSAEKSGRLQLLIPCGVPVLTMITIASLLTGRGVDAVSKAEYPTGDGHAGCGPDIEGFGCQGSRFEGRL